jgi:hypothetical protein
LFEDQNPGTAVSLETIDASIVALQDARSEILGLVAWGMGLAHGGGPFTKPQV